MRTLLLALLLVGPHARADTPPAPPEATYEALRAREAQLLEAVRAFDPARHEELLRLEQIDRRAYVAALVRIARFVDRAAPQGGSAELRAELARLEQLRAAQPDGFAGLPAHRRAEVRAEVVAIAQRIFDLRQAERRARVAELKASLAGLEADIHRRDVDRDALVERFADAFLAGRPEL